MKELNVKTIFEDSLVTVTQQIAGLELQSKDNIQFDDNMRYIGVIRTKGRFEAIIQFVWSKEMYDYIIFRMTDGQSMSDDDKVLYINEYMNITCGHALSMINNEIGRPSSRLSIPEVFRKEEKCAVKTQRADASESLNYDTEHGKMRVKIDYAMGL